MSGCDDAPYLGTTALQGPITQEFMSVVNEQGLSGFLRQDTPTVVRTIFADQLGGAVGQKEVAASRTPLSRLFEYPLDEYALEAALKDPSVNVDGRDSFGLTMLHKCCAWNSARGVQMLLAHESFSFGAAVAKTPLPGGQTAAHLAVDSDAHAALCCLLSAASSMSPALLAALLTHDAAGMTPRAMAEAHAWPTDMLAIFDRIDDACYIPAPPPVATDLALRTSDPHTAKLVNSGRLHAAWAFLARPYCLSAEVVHGEKRGRTIGYPTANLGNLGTQAVPPAGVYAGWLTICPLIDSADADPSSVSTHLAAISIGTSPTFAGERDVTVEAYAILPSLVPGTALTPQDPLWMDLYGRRVSLELAHTLRPMVKFDGADWLEQLMRQMALDCEQTRELCATGRMCGPPVDASSVL